MTSRSVRWLWVACLVAVWLLGGSGVAAGASVSREQADPGVTTTTIWSQSQVAIYKLPGGVSHTGYIHMQVDWSSSSADFDLFLLDKNYQFLNVDEGYGGFFFNRECIDWKVTSIADQTIVENPESHKLSMVGDDYYVMVVSFSGSARFRLWGYYPQIDLSEGNTNVNSRDNLLLTRYWNPARSKPPLLLRSAPADGFVFTPTSLGTCEARLEWPADVSARTVSDDHANDLMPSNFEQYIYVGADWDDVAESYGEQNWWPPSYGQGDDRWWGLQSTWDLEPDGTLRPRRPYLYLPVLMMVAADPAQGPFGPLETGLITVGYKATIVYPENLAWTRATRAVQAGDRAVLAGTFALNGQWVASGTAVKIQRRSPRGEWRTVATTRTVADGRWRAVVRPRATASWRAQAAGDEQTGLAIERSTARRVVVRGL